MVLDLISVYNAALREKNYSLKLPKEKPGNYLQTCTFTGRGRNRNTKCLQMSN